jgi:hypothetical protein
MLCLSPLLLEHYFVLLRNLDVNYVFCPLRLTALCHSVQEQGNNPLKKYRVIL